MKNTITRYNRSIIGLMETCNTGNWCEFSEVEDVIDKIDKKFNEFVLESELRKEKLDAKIWKQTKKLWTLEEIQQYLIITAGGSIVMNIIIMIKTCLN